MVRRKTSMKRTRRIPYLLWIACMLVILAPAYSKTVKASETFVPVNPSGPSVNILYVDPININITAPVIGQKPDFDSVIKAESCVAHVSDWQEKAAGNLSGYGISLTNDSVFEAGKTYTVLISVRAMGTYRFNTVPEAKAAFLSASRINGKQPECYAYSDTSMTLMVDFTLDAYLNAVDITITEPKEGLTPGNTKATVNKGACTAEILTWMKKEGSDYKGVVGETEKFVAGKTYSAFVAVYPKAGFFIDVTENGRKTFLGSSRVNGITPYVGGPFSGWTDSGSEFVFQIDLKAKEKDPVKINGIDITITEPMG